MARIQDIAPDVMQFTEAAAPATPASGVVRVYAKSDGKLYCKDDAGVEYALVGATAADVGIVDTEENFTADDVEGALAELFTSVSDGKTAVAAAITDKGVETAASDSFSTMATNIGSIASGGGTPTAKDVNFYDYDGLLIAGYTIAEANALGALPSGPDHTADGLTFQEWNYTLVQVNATTIPINIGATYITTDGKTHLYIKLTAVSGVAPTLYLYKSDESTLTVDWGDSSSGTWTNNGMFNTGAHTYAAAGDYVIKMWISSGAGTYALGNGFSDSIVVGGSNQAYKQTLIRAHLGSNVSGTRGYAFMNCSALTSISVSSGVTSLGDSSFQGCYSLRAIFLPIGVTSVGNSAFQGCYSLAFISIPIGVTSIGVNMAQSCYSLATFTIPSGVTSVGGAFYNCFSLTSITIPSSVTSISNSAFYDCFSLKYCVVQPTSPPTLGTGVFADIASSSKIRVPTANLAAYQSATNWSTYANYMEGY